MTGLMARTPAIDFRLRKNAAMRAQVFARDNYSCVRCGVRAAIVPANYDGTETLALPSSTFLDRRYLHVDHVRPRHSGGPSTIENLQTLCESCNCSKGGQV